MTTFQPSKLKALRESLGLSQDDLAKRAGITKQALSAWETGLWLPNIESLLKLVDATGCKIEVFFERGA